MRERRADGGARALVAVVLGAIVVVAAAAPAWVGLSLAIDVLLGDGDALRVADAGPGRLAAQVLADLRGAVPATSAVAALVATLRVVLEIAELGRLSRRVGIALGAALVLGSAAGALLAGGPDGAALGAFFGLTLSGIGGGVELVMRRWGPGVSRGGARRAEAHTARGAPGPSVAASPTASSEAGATRRIGGPRVWLALVLLGGPPSAARAELHVLLVGGGPTAATSEARAELDLEWLQSLLRERTPTAHVTTLFGAGPGADVAVVVVVGAPEATATAWSQLFDVQGLDTRRYVRTRLRGLAGPAGRASLLAALAALAEATRAGDEVFIAIHVPLVGQGPLAALSLWRDERVSVGELAAALDRLDPGVVVRFFAPRCDSGPLAALASPSPRAPTAARTRCGFFAAPPDTEGAACLPSWLDDDAAYGSAWLAALDGRTRAGEVVAGPRDLDGDGRVGLDDAHGVASVGVDLAERPRSSSELLIEAWGGWSTRGLSTREPPEDARDARLAERLASRIGLLGRGASRARAVVARLAEVRASHRAAGEVLERLAAERASYAEAIQRAVVERWPAASPPHTQAYLSFVREALPEAQAFVARHPDRPALARLDAQREELEAQRRVLTRQLATLERLAAHRARARAEAALTVVGSEALRGAYARLRACQSAPLGAASSGLGR